MNKLQSFIAKALGIKSTTLRNPADWFMEALGYNKSASGEKVSHAAALSLSPYYCGVRMISETVGSLPLNVYKRRPVRGQDVYREHPVHSLLHSEPNPEMTAMSFRQTLCAHAIGYGNAYAEIVRRGDGTPAQLWPLCPDRVKAKRDENDALWYEVRLDDGGFSYIAAKDVLHVPGLGFDGISGYSLISVAMESIGINLAQEKYSGKFFSNGGHVSAVIETDNVLQDETFERLKSEIAKNIGGLDNAHRIAILESGLKLKPTNISNTDAQLIEGKRFSIEDWARWLNIPPHKLKEMARSTFSNIEHQNIEWAVDSIRPWLERFEQEYNRKLFKNKNQFYSKHVIDGLLRGDHKSRNEAYAIGRNWGWLSANDVLALEDRNPLPGDLGDIYLVPGNMTRAEDAGQQMQPEPPPPEPDEDDEIEAKLDKIYERIEIGAAINKIDNKVEAGQTHHFTLDIPEQFMPNVNVDNHIHIDPQEAPVVNVDNLIDIPAQQAPVVNVDNRVEAPNMEAPIVNINNDIIVPENVPDVMVTAESNSPDVIINVPENVPNVEITNQVDVPEVRVDNTVNVPSGDRSVTFRRDADGNIIDAEITDD